MTNSIQKSYGINENTNLKNICHVVCKVLGNGANDCVDTFMHRIMGAETGHGTIKDTTVKAAGNGIFQHDRLPFEDNQSRYKQRHIDKVILSLDINISRVKWEELEKDIQKGALACRLHFKPFSEPIPGDIVGQAQYWKRYYNTEAGQGSVKHFLEMNDFDMSMYDISMEVVF